ncbi:MAG: hypothetical protein O9328_15915 [Rhodobacteraceae bacterium]|nr:hypothetical protein [Paracoccaceae bacterium]
MKVLMGGAAALALAVMAGQTVAGGMDVPDADISAISDSDAGGDAGAESGQQDGTDGPRSDGSDTSDTGDTDAGDAGDTDAGATDVGETGPEETGQEETGETDTNTEDSASEEDASFTVTGFPDGEWSDDFEGEIVYDNDTADGFGTEDTADTGTDETATSGTEGATDDTADDVTEGDTGDSTDDSTDTTTDSGSEWPIDYTSHGPVEDSLPDVMITITSEPQSQPDMLDGIAEIVLQPTASAPPGAPGIAPDLGVADIGAASLPNDDGTDCVFRPDRRAVICD